MAAEGTVAADGSMAAYVSSMQTAVTPDSFNEMDGIVFSSLSYFEYEKVLTPAECQSGMSVPDFCTKMMERLHLSSDSKEYILLKSLANSKRYEKCQISNLAACNDKQMWTDGRTYPLGDDSQWGAMTIGFGKNDPTNSAVIAMRGTNGTTLGWNEDFELGYEVGGTTAQCLSRDYLKYSEHDHLILCGHSKGGNDVTSGYMMSDQAVRDKVDRLYNYDGPGHNDEFIDQFPEGYKELDGKLNNYYPQDSIVGQLLNKAPGESHFIYSEINSADELMLEHDPYNFRLNQEGFVEPVPPGQSLLSDAIDKSIDSCLAPLSAAEKIRVMNAIIHMKIPAMIAGEATFDDFMTATMQMPLHSPEEFWAAMMTVRGLLECLKGYGIIKAADFIIPGTEDFIYLLRDLFADVWRNFKNGAEELWNRFWNWTDKDRNQPSRFTTKSTVFDFGENRKNQYAGSGTQSGNSFSVSQEILLKAFGQLSEHGQEISRYYSDLQINISRLPINGSAIQDIQSSAEMIGLRMQESHGDLQALREAGDSCIRQYTETEENIMAGMGRVMENMS